MPGFDREILQYVCENDYNFPVVKDSQFICTQAQARVAGLPSALDKSAKALGLQRKSASGTRLINACCIPPFSKNPQDYCDLGAYCLQDWVVMDEVARAIPQLNETQIQDYQYNERVNDRGIKIDRELAVAAQEYAEAERAEINIKIKDVTCEYIDTCTQYVKVARWIRECLEDDGLNHIVKLMVVHKTDKDTGETKKTWSIGKSVRATMLAGHKEHAFHLPSDVHELLELMDEAGGSATSKFKRMSQRASREDDRVRGALRYAGAPSTLRYSSLGLQVHNFRRDVINLKDDGFGPQFVIDQIKRGEVLKDKKGKALPVMDTLGRLLRSAIIPEEGNILVVGDWNAVESRMTAWLSDDQNKLDIFRRGEDPYCYAAELVYGRHIDPLIDIEERRVGKVVDLALLYLGGEDALTAMATQYRVFIDPDKKREIVWSYRAGHPKIVAYGDALLAAAHRAVIYPDKWQVVGKMSYYFNSKDGALYCKIPGNRNMLRYPQCRFEMKPMPWDKDDIRPQLTALKAAFTPKAGAKEWARHGIWRGICLENGAQATCAQRLRECNLACEAEDLPVIFHAHDEIILEVFIRDADEAVRKLTKIMEFVPEYLTDLPLVAKPVIMYRYGK